MRIGFIPIDNRPVCYTLPKLISEINPDIELLIPERKLLGDLENIADINALFDCLKSWENLDALIISLDTLIFGGLIPSRRSTKTLDEIYPQLEKLKEMLEKKRCKIYAFSSIMRISNNNVNQEEKQYWDKYGKKIFEYSYLSDKNKIAPQTDIPPQILEDYIDTRKRNFEINKVYLKWQKAGIFDTLVFSKDDCAEFGFNVEEARALSQMGGFVKTGADEIPLSLLSRAMSNALVPQLLSKGRQLPIGDVTNTSIKICPIFLEPEYKNLISNYEDISIEESVKGQIELAGCKVSDEVDADIILLVNNFKKNQGEIVMKVNTESYNGNLKLPQKPFIIADVRFANGSDNSFVKNLFEALLPEQLFNLPDFLGYSAWNTSANTLGSLIAGAIAKFSIENYNKIAFEKLILTRFLDDWAYQANVRQQLKNPDINELKSKMKSFEKKLGCDKMNIGYKFPWKRLFEVEVELS
ncbi:MAG: DUF4127 family protein [Clostridiaceae bacterium]|jgi:hypothetical protein|nr:DUF4127 family protein [Clostridiaceae bacterium]